MKTATAAKIAAQFDEFLAVSQEQPVLVTRNGKPVAMLVAVHDKQDAEQLASGRSRTLRSVFEESHERMQKEGTIPQDEFWQKVEQSRRSKQSATSRRKGA